MGHRRRENALQTALVRAAVDEARRYAARRRAEQRCVELALESRVFEGCGELRDDAVRRAEEQALDVCVLGVGQRMKGARLVASDLSRAWRMCARPSAPASLWRNESPCEP